MLSKEILTDHAQKIKKISLHFVHDWFSEMPFEGSKSKKKILSIGSTDQHLFVKRECCLFNNVCNSFSFLVLSLRTMKNDQFIHKGPNSVCSC